MIIDVLLTIVIFGVYLLLLWCSTRRGPRYLHTLRR
jgi:hypothetical protein